MKPGDIVFIDRRVHTIVHAYRTKFIIASVNVNYSETKDHAFNVSQNEPMIVLDKSSYPNGLLSEYLVFTHNGVGWIEATALTSEIVF